MKQLLLLVAFVAFARPIAAQTLSGEEIAHQWNRCVIEVIMEDGFGPPIAARIHAYSNLAGYQAAYHAEPTYISMVGKLNGFTSCPEPDPKLAYDWRVSAVAAYQVACSKLLYRTGISDSLAAVHFSRLEKDVAADVFARSKDYGIEVGKSINAYAKGDGYARTQGLPDYEWPRCDSCWIPTPPNFAKPLSPYCGRVRTIVLSGPNEFPVPPSIPFSTKKGSPFYAAAMEVIETSKTLTEEQRQIANFWNDNPVLTNYHGHFIFNSRQISPGGHWMNITERVLRDRKAGMVRSMEVYSMTAFALFDGFTACWAEKFRGNLIRPVTYINKYIESSWEPLLQTPPFPEHASGHSTITAAAAEVLMANFGDVAFVDSTEVPFGWAPRPFKNFREAAAEASVSRLYGGIHYRRGCDAGNEHGTMIGKAVVQRVQVRKQ
ncbi:MAG: vanadium-dependent haloperoxidase [Ignavibacteria bacterium]|nr:vanadium-dependent haloperoxidase [Ignavibacteria bacterium]MBP7094198.1 vanadium-dependent haloperoxidase [Candidatus Kapabacteria bacterium]MBK6419159.1 vanadium-dependent haloperoxidase [Ignavibacteria bacterium]MBK7412061.1 vanadium-dependent haloperoxidase [Ignavibacteria bacterium]MBK7575960.1 vanadium-dependent haloperoxidase [Ignavibacteria bacterium]